MMIEHTVVERIVVGPPEYNGKHRLDNGAWFSGVRFAVLSQAESKVWSTGHRHTPQHSR